MRRRERWVNLAWLRAMPDDPERFMANSDLESYEGIEELLQALTNQYLRYVELERDGDNYRVRLLPIAHVRGVPSMDVGMSYGGKHLRPILSVAKRDCANIASGRVVPCVGNREVVRWVK